MRISRRSHSAFTLVEVLIAAVIAAALGVGLLLYSTFATRLISGNMATNHSHDTVRVSIERMMYDMHGAASSLRLVNFDGTTYTDATPTATSDQDPLSGQYLSTRHNAVRYYKYSGGPYKLLGDAAGSSPLPSTATVLQFEFGPLVGGNLPYVPSVGDKMQLPLISREFTITAVNVAPTTSNTKGTVTLDTAVGFILYTVGPTPSGVANPITTGLFYEKVGYSVWNNELRYHKTFPPATASDTMVLRGNVTSTKPFSVLFPTTTGLSDNLNLRVSLESYDLYFGLKIFQNSTTTLQSVLPSRTQPATLNSN